MWSSGTLWKQAAWETIPWMLSSPTCLLVAEVGANWTTESCILTRYFPLRGWSDLTRGELSCLHRIRPACFRSCPKCQSSGRNHESSRQTLGDWRLSYFASPELINHRKQAVLKVLSTWCSLLLAFLSKSLLFDKILSFPDQPWGMAKVARSSQNRI